MTAETQERVQDPYQIWMDSQGLPIYRGHSIGDLRDIGLAWWPARQCAAAFLELAGQEGVTEARVEEIPAGKSLPAQNFAFDELVYVADGQGTTSVWTEGRPKKTFEWQKFSFFVIPGSASHQFTNMQGDRPARLLRYNYLPLAMSLVPFASQVLLQNRNYDEARIYNNDRLYAEATETRGRAWGGRHLAQVWQGNFFPDMRAWDKLRSTVGSGQRGSGRGAGGTSVMFRFPDSEMSAHMSVFPARTYKKAHRHGPGRIIVIPAGEGYSILWEEGKDKIVVPWQESSVFTPPDKWFHQHFNTGSQPARYLALHPPPQLSGYSEQIADRARDQIEYPDEDPFIRAKFEAELREKGLTTLMPEQAYKDRHFDFSAR